MAGDVCHSYSAIQGCLKDNSSRLEAQLTFFVLILARWPRSAQARNWLFTSPGLAASSTVKQSMISPAKCCLMMCLYGGKLVHSSRIALMPGYLAKAACISLSMSCSESYSRVEKSWCLLKLTQWKKKTANLAS